MKNSTATKFSFKKNLNVSKDKRKVKYPRLTVVNSEEEEEPFFLSKEGKAVKLYIKNMVSLRCKMVVKAELDRLKLSYAKVELGEVVIPKNVPAEKINKLKTALLKSGLELMDDKRAILVEKIKNLIVEMIHYADELTKVKKSIFISEKLHLNYTHLSSIFSEVTGITIEHYIIMHKIERAKELIVYNELSLDEIAYKLHYSSASHLSKQFKQVTGLTPTFFKALKDKRRTPLENL